MPIPGRLHVDSDGRVNGPVSISHNTPFPCVNGRFGNASAKIRGFIMHTMVGNLPGTIAVFNQPGFDASAHFGIDQKGHVHQFGPIGHGWDAWAQGAGNDEWYSVEHADNGNPNNPLTAAQIDASAQLLEVLSRFAGFPLQVTDSTSGTGYGTHNMGGAAWGGHTCPDLPPHHVRSRQRGAIVALAKHIRTPGHTGPTRHVVGAHDVVSFEDVAKAAGLELGAVMWETAHNEPGGFGQFMSAYVNGGNLKANMKPGTAYWLPAH